MPAIARWKAWEWRFAGEGSRTPTSVPSAGASAVTASIRPAASMSTLTALRQPSAVNASFAQIFMFGGVPRLTLYYYV